MSKRVDQENGSLENSIGDWFKRIEELSQEDRKPGLTPIIRNGEDDKLVSGDGTESSPSMAGEIESTRLLPAGPDNSEMNANQAKKKLKPKRKRSGSTSNTSRKRKKGATRSEESKAENVSRPTQDMDHSTAATDELDSPITALAKSDNTMPDSSTGMDPKEMTKNWDCVNRLVWKAACGSFTFFSLLLNFFEFLDGYGKSKVHDITSFPKQVDILDFNLYFVTEELEETENTEWCDPAERLRTIASIRLRLYHSAIQNSLKEDREQSMSGRVNGRKPRIGSFPMIRKEVFYWEYLLSESAKPEKTPEIKDAERKPLQKIKEATRVFNVFEGLVGKYTDAALLFIPRLEPLPTNLSSLASTDGISMANKNSFTRNIANELCSLLQATTSHNKGFEEILKLLNSKKITTSLVHGVEETKAVDAEEAKNAVMTYLEKEEPELHDRLSRFAKVGFGVDKDVKIGAYFYHRSTRVIGYLILQAYRGNITQGLGSRDLTGLIEHEPMNTRLVHACIDLARVRNEGYVRFVSTLTADGVPSTRPQSSAEVPSKGFILAFQQSVTGQWFYVRVGSGIEKGTIEIGNPVAGNGNEWLDDKVKKEVLQLCCGLGLVDGEGATFKSQETIYKCQRASDSGVAVVETISNFIKGLGVQYTIDMGADDILESKFKWGYGLNLIPF